MLKQQGSSCIRRGFDLYKFRALDGLCGYFGQILLTYLFTYLITYLFTYLNIYLITYLLIYLLNYLFIY